MDQPQERQVALGLREGNPDAWRALYQAYAGRVWTGVARLMGPTAADLADVVQETFLAAARSARTYDPERGALWLWLWGIARRHVALHYRKNARHDRLRAAVDDGLLRWLDGTRETPPDALLVGEAAELVRATLLELPEDYEALLTAKYLDGEPVTLIAEREKTSEVAVRSKLARARQAFREAFGKYARSADRPAGTTHHDPAGR